MAEVAAAKEPTAKENSARTPKALKTSGFSIYGHAFERLTATIPADYEFDDCLRPGFWTNVVEILKKNVVTNGQDRSGSIIELRTEDHAFYAELYIRAVLARGLIVQCIGPSRDPKTGKACPIDLQTGLPWTGQKQSKSQNFDLKWNVGKRGFDIIRRDDQQIVGDASNFPTRELAQEWLAKTAGVN